MLPISYANVIQGRVPINPNSPVNLNISSSTHSQDEDENVEKDADTTVLL